VAQGYDSEDLALKLEEAYGLVIAGKGSLETVIRSLIGEKHSEDKKGKISTSRGAGDINSADTPIPGFSPNRHAKQYLQLLRLFKDAKRYLIAQGVADPSDAQLYSEMDELLRCPVTECRNDYSLCGWS
jgi:hypothetical protein